MSQLGNRIRWERISQDMTQADLGTAVGCCALHISRIEHGYVKVSRELVTAIACALGVTVELLNTPLSGKISYLTLRSLRTKKRKAGIEDARIKTDYRGTEEGA